MKPIHIVVGASGQVGSHLLSELRNRNVSVRAVVRNAGLITDKEIETKQADLFNAYQLTKAFEGGDSVFILTPENPKSKDIISDTLQIVENYRTAIKASGIRKVFGLSCVGAHLDGDTGNIRMSKMLEEGLDSLPAEKIFIRPSYYYSNWLPFLDAVKQYKTLPSFFPEQLELEMHSPVDLARFIAGLMTEIESSGPRVIHELAGPRKFSVSDVAAAFSSALNIQVNPSVIPRDKWLETLLAAGFTENTATNLALMTEAVIKNLAVPENPATVVRLPTHINEYVRAQLEDTDTH